MRRPPVVRTWSSHDESPAGNEPRTVVRRRRGADGARARRATPRRALAAAPAGRRAAAPRRAPAEPHPSPSRRQASPSASPVSSPCSAARDPGSVSSSTAARSGHVSPSSATKPARSCSERNGSFWNSDSSQRSSASARALSASARPSRTRSSPASAPRKESRRVASPGGCVAAIGRTGRMPYGLPSSVSKRTGPAESGAAVASRIALTASAISAGASGGSSGAGERRAKLEHAVAVGLAAEVLRHHRARLGPVTGKLAVGHRADPQSGRELELRRDGDADERRDRHVGAALTEERALELGVGAVERVVVPVESAARLGGGDEQAEQHGAEQGLVLRRSRPGVGAREDRRQPARAAAPRSRSAHRCGRAGAAPAPRRTHARAGGTRTAPGHPRARARRTPPAARLRRRARGAGTRRRRA